MDRNFQKCYEKHREVNRKREQPMFWWWGHSVGTWKPLVQVHTLNDWEQGLDHRSSKFVPRPPPYLLFLHEAHSLTRDCIQDVFMESFIFTNRLFFFLIVKKILTFSSEWAVFPSSKLLFFSFSKKTVIQIKKDTHSLHFVNYIAV